MQIILGRNGKIEPFCHSICAKTPCLKRALCSFTAFFTVFASHFGNSEADV